MKKSVSFQHNQLPQGAPPCQPEDVQPEVVGDGTVLRCANCQAQQPFNDDNQVSPSVFPPASGSFERPTFATASVGQMFDPFLA